MNISIFDMSANKAGQDVSLKQTPAKDMSPDATDSDFTDMLDAEINNAGNETASESATSAEEATASDVKDGAFEDEASADVETDADSVDAETPSLALMSLNIAPQLPVSDDSPDSGSIGIARSTQSSKEPEPGFDEIPPDMEDEGLEEVLTEQSPVFGQDDSTTASNEAVSPVETQDAALDSASLNAEALSGNREKATTNKVSENKDRAGEKENSIKDIFATTEEFEPAPLAHEGAMGQGTDEGAPESDSGNSDSVGFVVDEFREGAEEQGGFGVHVSEGDNHGAFGLSSGTGALNGASGETAETAYSHKVFDAIDSAFKSTASKGLNEVRLRLNPPNLGELNIRLSLEENLLNATITVDNESVKGILESNSASLKDVLLRHGISLDNFVVELKPGAESDLMHGSFRDSMHGNMFYNPENRGYRGNARKDEPAVDNAQKTNAPLFSAKTPMRVGVNIFV